MQDSGVKGEGLVQEPQIDMLGLVNYLWYALLVVGERTTCLSIMLEIEMQAPLIDWLSLVSCCGYTTAFFCASDKPH